MADNSDVMISYKVGKQEVRDKLRKRIEDKLVFYRDMLNQHKIAWELDERNINEFVLMEINQTRVDTLELILREIEYETGT